MCSHYYNLILERVHQSPKFPFLPLPSLALSNHRSAFCSTVLPFQNVK